MRWCLMLLGLALFASAARAADPPPDPRFAHTVYLQPYSKLRQAAELGDAEAQYDLAYLYYKANSDPSITGIVQSDRLAAHWYRKAALQGHARAQYNMAVLHLHGRGVERDAVEAYAWLLQAAAGGHGPSRELMQSLDSILNEKQVAAARERSVALGVEPAP